MTQKLADPHADRRKRFLDLVHRLVRPGSGSTVEFLNQRTWSHPVTDLNAIIQRVPFVVVGGVATRLYMPERMTLDVDILIRAEDSVLVYGELQQSGHQRTGDLSIGGSQWQLLDGTCLDILEGTDDWVVKALAEPNYGPDGLPVITLPYLVLMKLLAGRSQDLADISRMLGGALEEELDSIRGVVGQYLATAQEDLESLIALGQLERQ